MFKPLSGHNYDFKLRFRLRKVKGAHLFQICKRSKDYDDKKWMVDLRSCCGMDPEREGLACVRKTVIVIGLIQVILRRKELQKNLNVSIMPGECTSVLQAPDVYRSIF